jgi:hypothetical protein
MLPTMPMTYQYPLSYAGGNIAAHDRSANAVQNQNVLGSRDMAVPFVGATAFREQTAPADTGLGGLASDVSDEKLPCPFFMRTGSCAYGNRCKFKHPQDRAPPMLNMRGYPLRLGEPNCIHYIKKGWCAFGVTCKYNHPVAANVMTAYPSAPAPDEFSVPSQVYPSMPMYYMPPLQNGNAIGHTAPRMAMEGRHLEGLYQMAAMPQSPMLYPAYGKVVLPTPHHGQARVDDLAATMQALQLRGPL